MPDLTITEILEELEGYGVPKDRATALACRLLQIGTDTAAYRFEAVDRIAEVQVERQRCRGHTA